MGHTVSESSVGITHVALHNIPQKLTDGAFVILEILGQYAPIVVSHVVRSKSETLVRAMLGAVASHEAHLGPLDLVVGDESFGRDIIVILEETIVLHGVSGSIANAMLSPSIIFTDA